MAARAKLDMEKGVVRLKGTEMVAVLQWLMYQVTCKAHGIITGRSLQIE